MPSLKPVILTVVLVVVTEVEVTPSVYVNLYCEIPTTASQLNDTELNPTLLDDKLAGDGKASTVIAVEAEVAGQPLASLAIT